MNLEECSQSFTSLEHLIVYFFQGLCRLDTVESKLNALSRNKEYCRDFAGVDLMIFLDELITQDETATFAECTSSIASREIGYSGGMKERSAFIKKASIIFKRLDKLIPGLDVIVANKLLGWTTYSTLNDLHRGNPSKLLDAIVNKIISTRNPGDDYYPIYLFAVAYINSKDGRFLAKSEIESKNKGILEVNLPHTYARLIEFSHPSKVNFLMNDLGV